MCPITKRLETETDPLSQDLLGKPDKSDPLFMDMWFTEKRDLNWSGRKYSRTKPRGIKSVREGPNSVGIVLENPVRHESLGIKSEKLESQK